MEDNKKELLKTAIQNIKDKKYIETFGVLDKLAEEGDREAMYWLAERYKYGLRIPNEDVPENCDLSNFEVKRGRRFTYIRSDYEKSDKFLQQSSDLGFPPAQYRLGIKCYSPRAKKRDLSQAFGLFKAAAEQGYAPAMYRLSVCYSKGEGTELDIEKAIIWCKKAIEHGIPIAEYQLARHYGLGHDVENNSPGPIEPDLKKVYYWLKRSAEHNLPLGQYVTACYLLDGLGTEKNEQEAIELLKKAASRGVINAMDKLKELGIEWERKDRTAKRSNP